MLVNRTNTRVPQKSRSTYTYVRLAQIRTLHTSEQKLKKSPVLPCFPVVSMLAQA